MADLREIEVLIAAHAATWVTLDAACEATDNASGKDAKATAEAAQAITSEATFDAIWAIIEHPYSSLDGLKRGMAYLVEHHRSTGDGNLGQWLLGLACHMAGVSEEEAA